MWQWRGFYIWYSFHKEFGMPSQDLVTRYAERLVKACQKALENKKEYCTCCKWNIIFVYNGWLVSTNGSKILHISWVLIEYMVEAFTLFTTGAIGYCVMSIFHHHTSSYTCNIFAPSQIIFYIYSNTFHYLTDVTYSAITH